jgi:hypothetical protein
MSSRGGNMSLSSTLLSSRLQRPADELLQIHSRLCRDNWRVGVLQVRSNQAVY